MWYAQLDLGRRERWQRGWEPSPLAPWRTPGGHVSWCMWFSAGLLCRWLALPAVFHTCESDIGSSKRLRLTFKHRPLKALLGLTGIEFAPSPIQNGTEKTISFLIWWVSQLQLFILVLFLHVSCFLRRKLEILRLISRKTSWLQYFHTDLVAIMPADHTDFKLWHLVEFGYDQLENITAIASLLPGCAGNSTDLQGRQ